MTDKTGGAVRRVFVPIDGQCFIDHLQWVHKASSWLTAHDDYLDTEHGDQKGWRGYHFKALCFDQKGRMCRNGGDMQRAKDEDAFPVWWIWPDQIPALLTARDAQ